MWLNWLGVLKLCFILMQTTDISPFVENFITKGPLSNRLHNLSLIRIVFLMECEFSIFRDSIKGHHSLVQCLKSPPEISSRCIFTNRYLGNPQLFMISINWNVFFITFLLHRCIILLKGDMLLDWTMTVDRFMINHGHGQYNSRWRE